MLRGGSHEDLVEQVKVRQRQSPAFKLEWELLCKSEAAGTKDPAKHNAAFLRMALSQCDPSGADRKDALVQQVKELQRVRAAKEVWGEHCMEHGDGTRDPARHDVQFLCAALQAMRAVSASGRGGSRGRGRGGGRGRAAGQHQDPAAVVVQRQRDDPNWRVRWCDYCDEHGEGTRDPHRHTAAFLQSALDDLHGDSPQGDDHEELVESVKDLQRRSSTWRQRWAQHCDGRGTSRDPRLHECFFLRRALGAFREDGSDEHQKLVELVREKRKDASWCTRWADYCGDFGGGTRDPLSHQPSFLKLALRDLDGECDVDARRGLRRAAGEDLVAAVRAKQKADPRWQRRWAEYCEKASDGTRDPALHDAGFVRRAMREVLSPRAKRTEEDRRKEEIGLLCEARRKAQRSHAFERADQLRSMLWEMGVELDDSRKTWRSDDGLRGSYAEGGWHGEDRDGWLERGGHSRGRRR